MNIFCYRFGIVSVDLVKIGVLDCFNVIANFMVVITTMAGYGLGSIIHPVIQVRINGFNFS